MSESCKSDIKLITCIALSNAVFTPRIIIPGVPTAGDNFNIICRLDGVVERLAVTPFAVTLAFSMPPGGMAGNQSRNGSAYIREHILNPLMTSDVGTYRCNASTILSNGGFLAPIIQVLYIQSLFLIIKLLVYSK